MRNDYVPQPADVKDIRLPEELNDLVERLARNVHEVWAQGRLQDGWSYGEERDDDLKHHPCMVPYEELSESEKDYDRHTALETLRFIIDSGFKISKE